VLRWRTRRGMRSAGAVAGHVCKRDGYRVVNVFKKRYPAHRLAWFHHYGSWPSKEIDHINRIKDDNRIANLREATRSQNAANISFKTKSMAGFRGVTCRSGKFLARIRINGKMTHVGTFLTAADAHQAYCRAAAEYYGEFASFT
jgi:hypothetical protein